MSRLAKWWHNRRLAQATIATRMTRIESSVEQLARQISIHALATDTRLSVYDVLIPKTLADLNRSLQELSETQRRLADLMERRESGPVKESSRHVPLHTERSA